MRDHTFTIADARARAASVPVHAPSPVLPLSGVWCTSGLTAASNRGRTIRVSSRVVTTCLACRQRAQAADHGEHADQARHERVTSAQMDLNVVAWLGRKGLR